MDAHRGLCPGFFACFGVGALLRQELTLKVD